MAVVQDLLGEQIEGSFYPHELQFVIWKDEKKPNAVFKTRVRDKKKEYLK